MTTNVMVSATAAPIVLPETFEGACEWPCEC
jgi:hypothetical protein